MDKIYIIFLILFSLLLGSCGKPKEKEQIEEKINLDTTIQELTTFPEIKPIPVRGYGIVSGLWSTGSSECPPKLRDRIEKYIWQQLPHSSSADIKGFIESPDTAIVEIVGMLPPFCMTSDRFDLEIKILPQTQTTSLQGGYLFQSDLCEMSRLMTFDSYAKTVAVAKGQLFTYKEKESSRTRYYILGGGTTLTDIAIPLVLNKPNFYAANIIRNRINERFGPNTANALSRSEIQVFFPPRYLKTKEHFLAMIQSLYLSEDEKLNENRIMALSEKLKTPDEAERAEIALEAIGRPIVKTLIPLLKNPDEMIRLRAARCLIKVDDIGAITVLQDIVSDKKSSLRIEAIDALSNLKLKQIESFFSSLLEDSSLEIRLRAYEHLARLGSIYIKRISVGGDFFVDVVNCSTRPMIYAYRTDFSRIVIFGASIQCKNDIFLDMGQIMINARPGDKYASIVRRHPSKPKLVGPIKSSFKIEDIIRTLGYSSEVIANSVSMQGLGLSYSEILDIVDRMCGDGLVPAEFLAGPVTKAGSFLERSEQKTDNNNDKINK